ncbi:hypothetical protein LPJ75_007394, partial [Coemansia sp. RSA 2598]
MFASSRGHAACSRLKHVCEVNSRRLLATKRPSAGKGAADKPSTENSTQTTRPFTGYFDAVRDIMRMPVTTADPDIPSRRVTAEYCSKSFKQAPRNVTMLTRDFISDSLYNPA